MRVRLVVATAVAAAIIPLAIVLWPGGAPTVRVNTYRALEISRVGWVVGKPLSLFIPLPSFSAPVRIRRVGLVDARGTTSMTITKAQMLITAGRYHGEFMSDEPRNLHGGQLVGLSSVVVRAHSDPDLSIIASLQVRGGGCHEAEVYIDYSAVGGGETRRVVPPWYVSVDTGNHAGHIARVCSDA